MGFWWVVYDSLGYKKNMENLENPISSEVCFKTFVTWILKLCNLSNIWSRCIVEIVLESLQEGQHEDKKKVWKF